MFAGLLVGLFLVVQTEASDSKSQSNPQSGRESFAQELQALERLGSVIMPSEKDENDFSKLLKSVHERFPNEPAVMFWWASLHDRERRPKEAIQTWKQVLEATSKLLPDQLADFQSRSCERLVYASLSAFDEKSAEQYAKRAIELTPLHTRGYMCLVDVAFRNGKLKEAAQVIKSAAQKHGDKSPDLRTLHHGMLARFGDWDALEASLDALSEEQRRPEDYHHFKARLAELAGQQAEAFCHHFLAYFGGPANRPTAQRSKEAVEKIRFLDDALISSEILPLCKAMNLLERPTTAPEAWAVIKGEKAALKIAELPLQFLKARAASEAGQPAALELWTQLTNTYRNFVPGWVGLGEALEASNGDPQEVKKYFAKARSMEPSNWKVREIFRTGAEWKVVPEGAIAVSVDPNLAWGRFGFEPDFVVLSLDGRSLKDIPVHQRMSLLRLFQGGTVTYLPKGFKSTVTRDMELVFFEW